MGFIDFHGTKEDHFEDVLEYARDRQKEEVRIRQEKAIRRWMGEQLGDPVWGKGRSADVMRLLTREYLTLERLYGQLTWTVKTAGFRPDPVQLWKDLWIFSILDVIELAGIGGEKQLALLTAFAEKVFRLEYPVSMREHLQRLQENKRYSRYFRQCFALEAGGNVLFWQWIGSLGAGGTPVPEKLLAGYRRCLLLMAFYLFLSAEEEGSWIFYMDQKTAVLSELRKNGFGKRWDRKKERSMLNPLLSENRTAALENGLLRSRVLLFSFRKGAGKKEEEFCMVEELYAAIDDGIIVPEQIRSILPPEAVSGIQNGILTGFPEPDVEGLEPEETLYYMDHTVLYQGREEEEQVIFRSFRGTLYFTDRKILFRGNSSVDLPYDRIDRITVYDVEPQMLEIVCGGKRGFFQVPEIGTAYQVLKLIANRSRGETVEEEELPFTYEELVQKADLGACVFAFDYVMAGDLPEAFREQLRSLNSKLRGLQKTIDRYPERKEEIYQFLSYYVPEAVRVVTSYQRYRRAGLDDASVQRVYEKVRAAVQALDGALYKKISEIYHLETMDTVARAEALREILGQDGYVDPTCEIKYDRRY